MTMSKTLLAIVAAAMVASAVSLTAYEVCDQQGLDSNYVSRCNNCNGNYDCRTCVGNAYLLGSLSMADRCGSCNGQFWCYQCISSAAQLATRTGDKSTALNIADRCGSCNGDFECFTCYDAAARLSDSSEAAGMADRCGSCNGNHACYTCVKNAFDWVHDATAALNIASRCSSCNGNSNCLQCMERVTSYVGFSGGDANIGLSTIGRCVSCNGNYDCTACVISAMYTSIYSASATATLNLEDICTSQPSTSQCAWNVMGASSDKTKATAVADRCNINGCGNNRACSGCLANVAAISGDTVAADRCTQAVADAEAYNCIASMTYLATVTPDMGNRIGYLDGCTKCTSNGVAYACSSCTMIAYLLQDTTLAAKCSALSSNDCNATCQSCLINKLYTVNPLTSADIAACFQPTPTTQPRVY